MKDYWHMVIMNGFYAPNAMKNHAFIFQMASPVSKQTIFHKDDKLDE